MSSPVQQSSPHHTALASTHQNESDFAASDSDNDKPAFVVTMLSFFKEFMVVLVIFVAYTAVTSQRSPKITKSPAAYPFFHGDSLVTDWYRGQITDAIQKARSSDIAFVMFYAPWDAESQQTRQEFEQAAGVMQKEVVFAAVNCWQPGSECKQQYSKVFKWPVLIAYPTHGRGVQYNGPLEAMHMVRFLQNVCKPLIRITNHENLTGRHDSVVLAKIDVLPGSYEFGVFYATALRFLERDPFRDTVFAVVSQSNDLEPSIHLHVWNGTIEYDGDWTTESLLSWIIKHLNQVVTWVSPSGMKSLTLSSFIQPGPTLILFTSKNPLLQDVDYFNLLRQIAYEYHNCANNTHIGSKQRLISEARLKSRESHLKLKQRCARLQDVVTTPPNVWTNTTIQDICNRRLSLCTNLDPIELLEAVTDGACRGFLLAERYAPPIFEKQGHARQTKISGLACRTNQTLKFVAMDSVRYYQFAEKLGVDLGAAFDRSGVVIVNDKMETHHVMAANINAANLGSFVHNFTRMNLARSLGSKINVQTFDDSYLQTNDSRGGQISVQELTSVDFLATVLQPHKAVVVFYYSKQCAFCSGISHRFLHLAKMLEGIEEMRFARIDGDINLLPWEYTMESYPTILFFPANRKDESRAFPKNTAVTVPNLLGFILSNAQPALKLKVMWAICCQAKFSDEKDKCIASVRMETLAVIEKTLKQWRTAARKPNVLYKLQVLRHLHLLFAHSPHEIKTIKRYLGKIRDD